MKKLVIVDGSNLLFQMYYGMPSRIVNSQGKAVHGTLGFVGALLKIARMICPDHLAVVFDGEYTSERRELEKDYKANRPDYSAVAEEDTPFSQLPDIFRALEYLQIPYRETVCCEADDWIAACAKTYGDQLEVIIVSQDSDFFQLITDKVSVLRYRGKQSTLCDVRYIRDKLGIAPGQYAGFKALTGDSADNIPGIRGIGPKTAAALLAQFGSLEEMLKRIPEIQKSAVREAVSQNGERLRKNYGLICLTGRETLPFCLEETACSLPQITTMEVMKALELL